MAPTLNGGRYTPIGGPLTLYVASSEQAANGEWSAGLRALFPDVLLPPKVVFSIDVLFTRLLDLSDERIRSALGTTQADLDAPRPSPFVGACCCQRPARANLA